MPTTPRPSRARIAVTGRRPLLRSLGLVGMLLVGSVVAACSDDGGPASTTGPATSTTSSGTKADDRSSTTVAPTTTTTAPIPAVDPAAVPEGYQPLQADGVGVGLAVPASWDVVPVDPEDLAATREQLGVTDQSLDDLLAQAGGLLGDATSVAAVGPAGEGGVRPAVVVVQLALSLPTIPEQFVDQVTGQFTGMGATDVVAERVALPGLEAEARALSLTANLVVDGAPVPVRMLLVPASPGIALVTVRAADPVAALVLGSVAVG